MKTLANCLVNHLSVGSDPPIWKLLLWILVFPSHRQQIRTREAPFESNEQKEAWLAIHCFIILISIYPAPNNFKHLQHGDHSLTISCLISWRISIANLKLTKPSNFLMISNISLTKHDEHDLWWGRWGRQVRSLEIQNQPNHPTLVDTPFLLVILYHR